MLYGMKQAKKYMVKKYFYLSHSDYLDAGRDKSLSSESPARECHGRKKLTVSPKQRCLIERGHSL